MSSSKKKVVKGVVKKTKPGARGKQKPFIPRYDLEVDNKLKWVTVKLSDGKQELKTMSTSKESDITLVQDRLNHNAWKTDKKTVTKKANAFDKKYDSINFID